MFLFRCFLYVVVFLFVDSGSKSCRLHVMTPNRPLVFSGNESLTFAPYHTHYPQLESHMLRAGLQSQPNLWDEPLYMGSFPFDILHLLFGILNCIQLLSDCFSMTV